jgi:hypothetical protein
MSANRGNAVRNAVNRWAQMDASAWNTGLSTEGARLAQRVSSELVAKGVFRVLPSPPKRLMIWCSSNVFTAPLEWVAQFAAMGSEIVLKAPSNCPEPVLGLAEAFANLGVSAHVLSLKEGFRLLDDCDAVLGFGADASMANLETHIAPHIPRSLHGHKGSLAIVNAEDSGACAKGLIQDSILYDGRGCMSPIAVFCLGDADALYQEIKQQGQQIATPIGTLSLSEQAHTSRRTAIAKLTGPDHTLPYSPQHEKRQTNQPSRDDIVNPILLNKEDFEFLSLPRLIPIHPITAIADLDFLKGLPWSSCATDLPHEDLSHLGFPRLCSPGALQHPPLNRLHDGVDVLARLCGEVSEGL